LVILIAVRFVVGRRIEINVRESPARGGGLVHLHPRVSHRILDLSDRRDVLNCCELRFAKMQDIDI
jgi:hypothetical protein